MTKLNEIHKKYDKKMQSMATCLNVNRELIDKRLKEREDQGGKKMDPKIIDQQIQRLELPTKDEGYNRVSIAGDFDEKTGLYKPQPEVR